MKNSTAEKKATKPMIPKPKEQAPKKPDPQPTTTEVTKEDVYESHGTAGPDEAPEGNAWEVETPPDEDRDLVLEPPMRNTPR